MNIDLDRYKDHTCIYCEKYSKTLEFGKCTADKSSIYKCAKMKMIRHRNLDKDNN